MLEEQLGRRGDAVAPLRPVLRRILADIQERLTFRAQAFIKVESSFWRFSAVMSSSSSVYLHAKSPCICLIRNNSRLCNSLRILNTTKQA